MIKKIGYIGIFLALLLFWALAGGIGKYVGKSAVDNYERGKEETMMIAIQEAAAKNLQKQLPMQIDEMTTLQNATSAGVTVVYHYRVKLRKSEIDHLEFINSMRSKLKTNVCAQEDMAYTMKYGGRYKYSYFGSDGIEIGHIEIDKTYCDIN